IDIIDGKPKWDTNILLHAIREYGRDMSNVRQTHVGSLRTWCWELLELRNAPSHFDKDNYHIVNSDRKLGHQAELAINLLKAFSADKEASEIEALMDGAWSSGRPDRSKTKGEPEQVRSPPGPSPSEMPRATFEASSSPPKTVVSQNRRRTPLPSPAVGVVL